MSNSWDRRKKEYKVLVGKPERRPLGSPSHRWEDVDRLDLS
jgi:hypothetical protein